MEEVVREFAVVEEQSIIDTLQDWIDWNVRERKNPSTIRMWFSCINVYLRYKGIKIDTKENIDFPRKKEEDLYPLQLEDIRKIFSIAKYDKKSLYLCQISSGMRISELLLLKKKDLEIKKRIIVKIPADNTKSKKGRTTFFSIEAQKLLIPRLRRFVDNDFIFVKNNETRIKYKTANEQISLGKYLEKIGLDNKYDNGHHQITTHSFRAYFITKISRQDPNFAKKLAGQKGYLLQYDRMTDEEKLEKYLEIESELLVDESVKKDLEVKKMKMETNSKILKLEERNLNLESKMDNVLKLLSQAIS
jgi:integrase